VKCCEVPGTPGRPSHRHKQPVYDIYQSMRIHACTYRARAMCHAHMHNAQVDYVLDVVLIVMYSTDDCTSSIDL
jgi:hypothetical protein